ncbi:hypothetical protein COX05_03570 [candidate division WWE3 bacterium CG22_combo_CG10-13_8_21_14_all_39_12]|uniref:Type II secretion system protein GspG C-terminal domain-containing protein n=2 Tax=Katanobacteria TaxID=422282 RepID=A0A2M7X0J9_UNCKA|nr:MAG: hypothetical protein COX05_03570 [candidate division WWE3 bacterium CG22_combo_CG10-13_8_21_14_all_39_12]PJA39669.1 MAG: hypothetical protein CO179_04725 [candidate division WWE3 bacterium CG_4_9_14_3_um_filter_39_7]
MHQRYGFTLIELLVVIVIIGLLAGIGIASFQGSIARSQMAKMGADMKEIAEAAKKWNIVEGGGVTWPADVIPDLPSTLISAGYLESFPRPPWPNGRYDWENWTNGTIQQVTCRDCSSSGVLGAWIPTYHLCIRGACVGGTRIN